VLGLASSVRAVVSFLRGGEGEFWNGVHGWMEWMVGNGGVSLINPPRISMKETLDDDDDLIVIYCGLDGMLLLLRGC
jgi:hypothetical protein